MTATGSNCEISSVTAWRKQGPPVTGDRTVSKNRDNVMTITELSAYLKISKSTLYKLAQEGKLPAQKVGRHWRFHREAVDSWLKRQPGGR